MAIDSGVDGPSRPEAGPGGPLEQLFSELIRRGASLGFTSFFLTEEAVRRAFSDRVPSEWLEYFARQGEEVRGELVDRLAKEFGNWLRSVDLAALLSEVLERYDVSAHIELSAAPKEGVEGGSKTAPSLQIIARPK